MQVLIKCIFNLKENRNSKDGDCYQNCHPFFGENVNPFFGNLNFLT